MFAMLHLFFPGQTAPPAPALYQLALAKPREGTACCLQPHQPCFHYRAQQGTELYLFTKSQRGEGFQASLSFPELWGVDKTSSSFVQGGSCN